MRRAVKLIARCILWGVLIVVFLVFGIMGYGISSTDAQAMRTFAQTVEGYYYNPDFRRIGVEYSRVGSQAVRTGVFGFSSGKVLHTLRQTPGLPARYAASKTLHIHYAHFAEGPLSAYLHMTGVQGVEDTVGMVERLAAMPAIPDDQAKAFLTSFDVWPAVSTDAGAIQSVRQLVTDLNAARPLTIRAKVLDRLLPHIKTIAQRHGWPEESSLMTVEQQETVLNELDEQVRLADPELWRTKQLSDFLSGVWGSSFGRAYAKVTRITVTIRLTGRFLAPAMLAGFILWRIRKARKAAACRAGDTAASSSPSCTPDPGPSRDHPGS